MKKVIYIMVITLFSAAAFSDTNNIPVNKNGEPEQLVEWVGYVETDGGHTTQHDHSIKFVRKSDGESFDIADSPALEKIHCDTSKKLLVKIQAVKTAKFLFWGNNLIVKSFKVIEELEDVQHRAYKAPQVREIRERHL